MKKENSASHSEDVREGSGSGNRGWKDVGTDAVSELRRKVFQGKHRGVGFKVSSPLGRDPDGVVLAERDRSRC